MSAFTNILKEGTEKQVALLSITLLSRCQSLAERWTPNSVLSCDTESRRFSGDLITSETFKLFSIPDFLAFFESHFEDFV